jgi:hypothetical protein
VYFELGAEGADSATLDFMFTNPATGAAVTNRKWNIKVTQIPCASNSA